MAVYLAGQDVDDREEDVEYEAVNRVDERQQYATDVRDDSPQDPPFSPTYEFGLEVAADETMAAGGIRSLPVEGQAQRHDVATVDHRRYAMPRVAAQEVG